MSKLGILLLGVFTACLCLTAASAEEMTVAAEQGTSDSYGYTADDVAQGQAVVAFWYACGYRNAFGNIPANFKEIVDRKVVARGWVNPFNGSAINPDDGTLDGDGDFMYWATDCDFGVKVKTSAGEISIPGTELTANSDISVQWDPSCCLDLCPGCCWIDCCDFDCWNLCDEEAVCRIVDWMMWKSFELHECLYGHRPSSDTAFFASGLSPVDSTYKEVAPNMTIEWVYKGDCCCYIKKAHVECCAPCKPCGCKDKCDNKCGTKCGCKQKTCTKCNKCDSKCDTKCGCEKKCDTKCDDNCGKCKTKCKPCCEQKTCTKCNKCDSKCDTKCGCEKKCDTKCDDKCGKCKPKCNDCKQKTCTKCNKCDSKCDTKCGCEKKCDTKCGDKCGDKCGCEKKCKPCCEQKTCTKCDKCGGGCKTKCGCR